MRASKNMTNCANQLPLSQEQPRDCDCTHRTEELRKELSRLQSKYDELERKVTEDGQKQLKLTDDVRGLQIRLESIESLLSIHTNDSKLNLADLRNKNKNRIPQDCKGSRRKENNVLELDDTAHYQSETVYAASKAHEVDSDVRNEKDGSENYQEKTKYQSLGRSVEKPNFVIQKPEQPKVTIVKQEVKLVFDGEQYWRTVAQFELDENRALFQQLEGVQSVICLDISESMSEGNAWSQARTFLTDYLKGLEEMSTLPDLKPEHVSLVTFGHETKFQMRYTDRYSEVQAIIDNLNLGGPSQMYGGVLYSQAAACCSMRQIEKLRNGAPILTKIIMITDGKPTESDLIAGPDIADSSKVDETKAKILQEMETVRKNRKDLFFVPVGTSDMTFHRTMETCSDGIILSYKSGRRLARRQYLSAQLRDPLGLMTDALTWSDDNLSCEDKEDMRSIQERAKRFMLENSTVTVVNKRTGVTVVVVNGPNTNRYNERTDEGLPPVGSRVRRGPDWNYSMQDSNGPGTLVGHSDVDGHVCVEWDTDGHINVYRYGLLGYDVLVVDEPRVLTPWQTLAAGCEVKPGKDWKSSGEKKEHGVVIKLDEWNKKAMVRWNDGTRGDYSYGDGGLYEIEIKSSLQKRGADGNGGSANCALSNGDECLIAETIEAYAAKQKKNKNKNTFS